MQRTVDGGCQCHQAHAGIPRIDGCVFAHDGACVQLLLGQDAAALAQNASNATPVKWDSVTDAVESTIQQLMRMNKCMTTTKAYLVRMLLKPELTSLWETTTQVVPNVLSHNHLLEIKRKYKHLQFLTLNKNTSKHACVCSQLYYGNVLKSFQVTAQFDHVA